MIESVLNPYYESIQSVSGDQVWRPWCRRLLRVVVACTLGMWATFSHSQRFTKLWGLASYFGRYEQVLYTLEPQVRWVDRSKKYEQSLVNVGVGYVVQRPWQVWIGQTYANNAVFNDLAEDVSNVVANEYRLWEQLMWHRPFTERFASRTRLEQRRAFQSSEWAVRLRERGYWVVPLNDTVSFSLSDELFLNVKSVPWVKTGTFDQNRLYVGLYYNFTPRIGLNISYLNQCIGRTPLEVDHGLVLNLVAYMD